MSWGSEDDWFDGGDPDDEHPARITSERTPEARRLDLQEWVVRRVLVAAPVIFVMALIAAILWPDNTAVHAVTTSVIAVLSALFGSIGGFLFGRAG